MKYISLIATTLLTFAVLSCKSTEEKVTPAQRLFDRANEAVSRGDGAEALVMIDSLLNLNGVSSEMLKETVDLRLRAIRLDASNILAETGQTITRDSLALEALQEQFITVKILDLEPFLIEKTAYNPDFASRTGISARVMPETGTTYITVSLSGKKGLNTVTLSSANSLSVVSDTIPRDLITSMSTGEMANLGIDASYRMAAFADSIGKPDDITLTFRNANGNILASRKLSQQEFAGLRAAKQYVDLASSLRDAVIERARAQAILQKANTQ